MNVDLNKIQFSYFPHVLKFRFEAGTSRGTLTEKKTFFIKANREKVPELSGWGEAAPLPKLSLDDREDFELELSNVCEKLSLSDIPESESDILDWVNKHVPEGFPSIRFAFEMALLDLFHGGRKMIFNTGFYTSKMAIPINGLIWMGSKEAMLEQIDSKLDQGFDCIKMKIGAIDFDQECELLGYIRSKYSADQITLRVDANGAFQPKEALQKLKKLAEYDLHSIEQPIRQGQWKEMEKLCQESPLAIALDEELIGIDAESKKKELLETIRPPYIILKPTLLGGIKSSMEWINIAESMGIAWWMTSALESNIGLNAIAQFTSTFDISMPQGLGTGQLYHNNVPSPLKIKSGQLIYDENEEDWINPNVGI